MQRIQKLTDAEQAAWDREVEAIEQDWPAIEQRLDLARAAAAEDSFSGELRRAIRTMHRRGLTMPHLLEAAQITWPELDPFLHGEGELSTTVVDRLARVLQLHIQPVVVADADQS